MCSIWAPIILKVRFPNQTSQNLFGIIARFEGLQDISRLFFVQKMILFKYIRDFPFPVQGGGKKTPHIFQTEFFSDAFCGRGGNLEVTKNTMHFQMELFQVM